MKNNKEKYLLFGIVFLVALVFAYLITNLSVNADLSVKSSSWDVHFENISVVEGSVSTDDGAIITDDTTIDLSAELTQPGDYYSFTVDVVNGGTIDAMVDSISIDGLEDYSDFLNLDIYYTTNYYYDLKSKDILYAGDEVNVSFNFTFMDEIDASDLPDEDFDTTVSIDIDYVQADGRAYDPFSIVYSFYGDFELGESILDCDDYYYTIDEVLEYENDYGDSYSDEPLFLKIVLDRDIISELYIGFWKDDDYYFVRGGTEGNSYSNNKTNLLSLFGNNNCTLDEFDENYELNGSSCIDSNYALYFYDNDRLQFYNYGCNCSISSTSEGHCGCIG